MRTPAPYSSPYVAGVGIGIVLLLAFVLMGRGLGASGAFSTGVATAACMERAREEGFSIDRFADCIGGGVAVGAVRASLGIPATNRTLAGCWTS